MSSQIPSTLARNRRKRYLELHPDYFSSSSLEHADPLLYDRLVRRWFTLAELEEERKQRGFSGMLEADLERSEARVEAARYGDLKLTGGDEHGRPGSDVGDHEQANLSNDTKKSSWALWVSEMSARMITGLDDQIDYPTIDQNEDLDDMHEANRDLEEQYFDKEDARWEHASELRGETGEQDF